VRLVVEHKLLASVKDQMENFLKGESTEASPPSELRADANKNCGRLP
jgi:hypothetical protein